MSKIHDTAVALRECLAVQRLADERSLMMQTCDSQAARNAQQVCSDAGLLIHTFEQELTAYVPECPADILTQALILSEYFHSHELEHGTHAEQVVRLLIGRLLEGAIKIAGQKASPIFEDYFNPLHVWSSRLEEVRRMRTDGREWVQDKKPSASV